MDVQAYRNVEGVWVNKTFHDDILRSAINYKPHPGDIFVAAYPKCGTTWTQFLALSILHRGEPPKTPMEFLLASPFLEVMGAEAAEKMVRPGPIKTHLPFHKVPFSSEAKYIYATRNPYDVCVSFYYQVVGFTPKSVEDVSFGRFNELFISGRLNFGDYFDHLLSWYEHRDLPNILCFTFEDMRNDTTSWTLKVADFLGKQYGSELRKDPALLHKVVSASSKENVNQVFSGERPFLKKLWCLPPEKAIKSLEVQRKFVAELPEMHEQKKFVRKGVVGDWKTHFTPDQIEKTKAWISEKTRGSDVMQLWKNCDLP
ncbi:sulfotransferase ssu-1-like [Amblyomma americanum]